MNNNQPILVTGLHRSGTTWVGRMLAADAGTSYIHEPLNMLDRPGVYRKPVKNWYTYITKENESEYLPAFKELLDYQYHFLLAIKSIRTMRNLPRIGREMNTFFLGKLRRKRVLIKDPFALSLRRGLPNE